MASQIQPVSQSLSSAAPRVSKTAVGGAPTFAEFLRDESAFEAQQKPATVETPSAEPAPEGVATTVPAAGDTAASTATQDTDAADIAAEPKTVPAPATDGLALVPQAALVLESLAPIVPTPAAFATGDDAGTPAIRPAPGAPRSVANQASGASAIEVATPPQAQPDAGPGEIPTPDTQPVDEAPPAGGTTPIAPTNVASPPPAAIAAPPTAATQATPPAQDPRQAKRRGASDHRSRHLDRGVKHLPDDAGPKELPAKPRFRDLHEADGPSAGAPATPSQAAAAPELASANQDSETPAPSPLPSFGPLETLARETSAGGVAVTAIANEAAEAVVAAPDNASGGASSTSTSATPAAPGLGQASGTNPAHRALGAERAEAAADAANAARFDRMLEQLNGELRTGKNEFRLRLDPPDLGRLDVRIVSHGDGVVVHLLTERSEVAQWIRSDLPMLHRSVEKDGLNVLGVDVRSWLDLDSRGQSGHRDAERLFDDKPVLAPKSVKPRAASASIGRPASIQASGLDLIV